MKEQFRGATAWSPRDRRRLGTEIVLAFAAAAAAFVLAALVSTASRGHVPALFLGLLFLGGVLAVARFGGVVYAVPVGIVTLQAYDWYFLPPLRDLDLETAFVLAVLIPTSVLVAETAARAARRAAASEESRGVLADSQAALRRVATLVAQGVAPTEVFRVVAKEVGQLVGSDATRIIRYQADGTGIVVAAWRKLPGRSVELQVGTHLTLDGETATAVVARTGRPARMAQFADAPGSLAAVLREAGVRSSVGAPIVVEGGLWGVMAAASTQLAPLPAGTESRMAEFTELVATAIANAEARTEIEQLAEEQAALRRVATLVARGVRPDEVFAAVAEEMARVLGVENTCVVRYEADASATIVATWGDDSIWPVGTNWTLEGESAIAKVFRTRHSARIDGDHPASGQIAALSRELGMSSVVAAPIIIEDLLWGAAVAPDAAEERIANFADLIAIAISNAKTRGELTASRARVVAAADETRRRLERDLHDGVQQRLVSLALKARSGELVTSEPSDDEAQGELSDLADDLGAVLDELRELSHGIHPAILSDAGLAPALKAMARRSAVPVTLDVNLGSRLDEPLEVAAYYVASEALANAVKHAEASVVELRVVCRDGTLGLSIRDDGIGGADPSRGSGLIGLRDRVEALGGTISVDSPSGDGTTLHAQFPVPAIA